MLGLAKRVGARFLLTSTSEVYGDPLQHPQKETYWGNVNPIGTYFFSLSLIFSFSLVNFGHHAKHVVSLFYSIETARPLAARTKRRLFIMTSDLMMAASSGALIKRFQFHRVFVIATSTNRRMFV